MTRPEIPTSPLDGHRRGLILMTVSILCFAGGSLIFKAAGNMAGVTGWTLTIARAVMGLFIVFVVFWPRGSFEPAHLVKNPLLILRGVLGGGNLVILYLVLLKLGAGRAVVLNCMYPIFASLLAAIFLKEKLRPVQLFWMGLAFFGLTLITGVWQNGGSINGYYALGILGAFIAGCVVVTDPPPLAPGAHSHDFLRPVLLRAAGGIRSGHRAPHRARSAGAGRAGLRRDCGQRRSAHHDAGLSALARGAGGEHAALPAGGDGARGRGIPRRALHPARHARRRPDRAGVPPDGPVQVPACSRQ